VEAGLVVGWEGDWVVDLEAASSERVVNCVESCNSYIILRSPF
jgi:hypothetical protein